MRVQLKTPPRCDNSRGRGPRSVPLNEPQNIPYGYCHCGCGQKTEIIKHNDASKGWVKGEPRRYIHPHWLVPPRTTEERFWEKVDKRGSDDCWEWAASCYPNSGYGMFYNGKRPGLAHRYSVELHRGRIPDGMVVDHLCRNRKCVNPAHLEVVTPEINSLRAFFDRHGDLCCEDCRRKLREAIQ